MSLLFYRRPDYVAKLPGPMNSTQCQVYIDRTQKHRRAIPPELSFENVLQNKALPVCKPIPRSTSSMSNISSHARSKISWTTSSTFRTTPRTFNSGSGFRLTPKDSTQFRRLSKLSLHHGPWPTESSQKATTRTSNQEQRTSPSLYYPNTRSTLTSKTLPTPPIHSCLLNSTNNHIYPALPNPTEAPPTPWKMPTLKQDWDGNHVCSSSREPCLTVISSSAEKKSQSLFNPSAPRLTALSVITSPRNHPVNSISHTRPVTSSSMPSIIQPTPLPSPSSMTSSRAPCADNHTQISSAGVSAMVTNQKCSSFAMLA